MVNVPPIPPLLCSTPPPIDFGEDDEDVDVLPPTLDVVDDDFGDFLAVNDGKSNEPLPSPRPPSLCDLPAVSIYDGLIPPDEEDLTNHTSTTATSSSSIPASPINETNKETKTSPKSINITEAFNFNVKNTNDDLTNVTTDESEISNDRILEKETSSEVLETQQSKVQLNNAKEDSLEVSDISATNRNHKDLTIDTSNVDLKQSNNNHSNNKTNISCMQNMVSIEDIEDDLSDDELYSPKVSKNFVETDNLNDYFKIEEIRSDGKEEGNNQNPIAKDSNVKSFNSLDNESLSSGNDNEYEFKSISNNSFITPVFDIPPPIQDDTTNSLEVDDEDDDFGEFADFQDFNATKPIQDLVKNKVPVEDINNKQLNNNDLEFNDFIDYNKSNDNDTHINNSDITEVIKDNGSREMDDEYEQFTSHTLEASVKFKENSKDLENISQGNLNDKCYEDFCEETIIKDSHEISKLKENISCMENEFTPETIAKEHENVNKKDAGDDFGNFAKFPQTTENLDKESTKLAENITLGKEVSQGNANDDDFDDFADFESHQETTKPQENSSQELKQSYKPISTSVDNVDDDDDDDFGDFNTAQPIAITASNLTQTSQNTTTAAPAHTTPTTIPATHNLNERISKILQLMFTPIEHQLDESTADANEPKAHKIQDIPFTSIDAAKALEYQWLNSDTRHSFIRSLGIDSRNILFGENWNPSLPRFAANLSFNPLKPMKPVQSSSSSADCTSTLEPISSSNNNLESSKSLEESSNNKKESLDLDWKAASTIEQTTEAFKDATLNQPKTSTNTTTLPYVSTEPPTEPVSLTMFENPIDNEEKFSKTPPISEMESVTTFSSPLPQPTTHTIDIDLHPSAIQIEHNNLEDFDVKEVEENLKNTLNINEVVVTSTFTGSFKETHIYTPPKTNDFETKQSAATSNSSTSPTKSNPIDFDYEKAAMGVIIDETVVKKEYRDVEYNPPFTMESLSKTTTNKTEMYETSNFANTNANILSANENITTLEDEQESNDDFSEFQSVTSDINVPPVAASVAPQAKTAATVMPVATKSSELTKTTTVSHGGMILSPAILIPQAISMENQKPKIEWGDSTASINPEELARIEELFPEPKSLKTSSSSNGSNSSQKSTPTHQVASTPSISATVANKELGGQICNLNNKHDDDDDDWSDFVSVTVTNNMVTNRSGMNNNILTKSPMGSPFKQRSPVVTHRMPPNTTTTQHNNSNNDDEWSDFVSSAPASTQPPPASYRVPQFNSGAWQNANFYNNPLSMYHKGPINMATASTHTAQKSLYNNNNNYNISQQHQQPYQIVNNIPPVMMGNNQQQQQQQITHNNYHQQQIHVMQNFSTAPVPTPERLTAAAAAAKNNQFQSIGSAKVAPSIALIPDLGFVAPAIPTHTSFINSLPKPSINTKK